MVPPNPVWGKLCRGGELRSCIQDKHQGEPFLWPPLKLAAYCWGMHKMFRLESVCHSETVTERGKVKPSLSFCLHSLKDRSRLSHTENINVFLILVFSIHLLAWQQNLFAYIQKFYIDMAKTQGSFSDSNMARDELDSTVLERLREKLNNWAMTTHFS